jgi:hypothetical protein
MAALVRVATDLRAILAAQVAFQFVDRRRLRPANDIQRHRLVGIAAEAADLEIKISGVERVAERRRRLRRALKPKHALIPGYAGEPVGVLARLFRAFRRGADRTAIDGLSRLGAHRAIKPQGKAAGKSCHGLGWERGGATAGRGWG